MFLLEAVVESAWYADDMARYLLNEGFFDAIKGMAKATGKLAKKAV